MHNFLTCFDSFYFTPIYTGIDFSSHILVLLLVIYLSKKEHSYKMKILVLKTVVVTLE